MKNLGWSSIPANGGAYVHTKTKAAMVLYVNNMLFIFSPQYTNAMSRDLEKRVAYKDPAASLQRYLGPLY